MVHKNTVCIWYDNGALDAATFYAETFPDSKVVAVHHAPGDFPSGTGADCAAGVGADLDRCRATASRTRDRSSWSFTPSPSLHQQYQ